MTTTTTATTTITTTANAALDAAIAEFIGDVQTMLAPEGATDATLEAIAARMRVLMIHPAVLATADAPAGNVHAGRAAGSGPLYTDDTGLTLVRARFGAEAPTPIHNHGTWGVAGVYRGRNHHWAYRRDDGGLGEGAAHLTMTEERIYDAGDAAVIPPPPHDIHAQQGDGDASYEFVLFGKNAMHIRRLYFDTATHTATLQPEKR